MLTLSFHDKNVKFSPKELLNITGLWFERNIINLPTASKLHIEYSGVKDQSRTATSVGLSKRNARQQMGRVRRH